MIDYSLDAAHPDYRRLLPEGFDRLLQQYPRAKLDRVELFAPEGDDLSLGNVDGPGTIHLSERWFSVTPAALKAAALTPPLYHGLLVEQPRQVIAHEFAHALLDGLGEGAQQRAQRAWLEATKTPLSEVYVPAAGARAMTSDVAPGEYSLAASGNEYFSELFAAVDLDIATESQRRILREIIGDDGAADEWSEADHPRGQPHNAGQFSKASAHGLGGRTKEGGGALPEHVTKLRIPPAWTDVRYSEDPDSPLLVVGRDAKGREQRVYSEKFAHTMAEAKFRRVEALANKLAAISKQNEAARRDPKKRDVADALALVMATGIRPGSDEDTRAAKRAYGATTLEGRHVAIDPDGRISLQFTGKKGVELDIPVEDTRLGNMLVERKRAAGDSGRLFPEASAARLLAHTHSLDGGSFKTKDFRTLLGTSIAQREVARQPVPRDARSYRRAVIDVARRVARKLGNTPTVALQAYIAPEVFGGWRLAAGA